MAKKQEEQTEDKGPRVQRSMGPRRKRLNKDQRDAKRLREMSVRDLVRNGTPPWKAKALLSAVHF